MMIAAFLGGAAVAAALAVVVVLLLRRGKAGGREGSQSRSSSTPYSAAPKASVGGAAGTRDLVRSEVPHDLSSSNHHDAEPETCGTTAGTGVEAPASTHTMVEQGAFVESVAEEPVYQAELLGVQRAPGDGPHAAVLLNLDVAIQALAVSAQGGGTEQSRSFVDGSISGLYAYFDVLREVSDGGEYRMVNALGDPMVVSDVSSWLDLFASRALDPLCERCTEFLWKGLNGDADSQWLGELLRDFLQYHLAEFFRSAGFEVISAFPFTGTVVDTGTMRVVSQRVLRGYERQVVGLRQLGLLQGRRVVRPALVVAS